MSCGLPLVSSQVFDTSLFIKWLATITLTQCLTLPVLHAFTWCICFCRQRKQDCMGNLGVFSEMTNAFNQLLCMPSEVSEGSMLLIERFVIMMYGPSESMEVNDARKKFFSRKSKLWTTFLQPTQHSNSTLNALATRLTVGTRHWSWIRKCQSHLSGTGQRKQPDVSSLIGQLSLKHVNHAMN